MKKSVCIVFLSVLLFVILCIAVYALYSMIPQKSLNFLNSTSSMSEEEKKLNMIHQECYAFACATWSSSQECDYIDIDAINRTKLQVYLNGYEYYNDITITYEDIINYLQKEMNEDGYSTKTYEDNPTIKEYVYWVNYNNESYEYYSDIIGIWLDYLNEVGITSYVFLDLNPEDINQLSEKLKNPDYEITIELLEE